ncbi:MAG: hypothetical protein HLUCCO16_20785 [Phormidium sp. OSCR]|nr:MAG: hypothetical protein HLUCCO16_20785 [Phormidium sp. OSCR]
MPFGEMPFGEMPFGEMPFGEMPVGELLRVQPVRLTRLTTPLSAIATCLFRPVCLYLTLV